MPAVVTGSTFIIIDRLFSLVCCDGLMGHRKKMICKACPACAGQAFWLCFGRLYDGFVFVKAGLAKNGPLGHVY